MMYTNERCELCLSGTSLEEVGLAVRLAPYSSRKDKYKSELEIVDLKGQSPWIGVRIICARCVAFIAQTVAQGAATAPRQPPSEHELKLDRAIAFIDQLSEHYEPKARSFFADVLDAAREKQFNDRVIQELLDLLRSACAIAERNGEGTHWQRFVDRLHGCGVTSVTAKTFRILPSDLEEGGDLWKDKLQSTTKVYVNPAYLVQEHTGKWHAFASREEGEAFTTANPGYTRCAVDHWVWHAKEDEKKP